MSADDHCRCIHRHADHKPAAGAEHDERRGEENPGAEGAVEPAADDDANENRRHDRPAEHADLAEPGASEGSGSSTGGIRAPLRPARASACCRGGCRRARSWRSLGRERRFAVAERLPVAVEDTASSGERARMQPRLLDPRRAVGVESRRERSACDLGLRASPDRRRCAPRRQAMATPLAACDPQYAAAQRAIARRSIRSGQRTTRRRQYGQEVRVAGQDAKARRSSSSARSERDVVDVDRAAPRAWR